MADDPNPFMAVRLLEELKNGRSDLAQRVRARVADRYDGAPPFRDQIPVSVWADALNEEAHG